METENTFAFFWHGRSLRGFRSRRFDFGSWVMMRFEGIAIIVLVRGVQSLTAWIFKVAIAGKETE